MALYSHLFILDERERGFPAIQKSATWCLSGIGVVEQTHRFARMEDFFFSGNTWHVEHFKMTWWPCWGLGCMCANLSVCMWNTVNESVEHWISWTLTPPRRRLGQNCSLLCLNKNVQFTSVMASFVLQVKLWMRFKFAAGLAV